MGGDEYLRSLSSLELQLYLDEARGFLGRSHRDIAMIRRRLSRSLNECLEIRRELLRREIEKGTTND